MAITAISCVLIAAAAIALFWTSIRDRYGPRAQHDSQCLICQRIRVEKWVFDKKVVDSISENEYSNWVDSFEPKDHQHVWLVSTSYRKNGWFGLQSIGCGGVPVISTIYSRREELGEQKARRLVSAFHRLVRSRGFVKGKLKPMDEFLETATHDPDSLLEAMNDADEK